MSTRVVLYAALAVTLALTAWLAAQPDEVAVVAPVVPKPRPIRAAAPPPAPAGRERQDWPEPEPAALAAWSAPVTLAPPPAASMPQRPVAPPFPYKWIGRLDDGEAVQALLSGPQRSFGARAGEVLDGRWRIEKVAASQMELTWLPTGDTVAVELR